MENRKDKSGGVFVDPYSRPTSFNKTEDFDYKDAETYVPGINKKEVKADEAIANSEKNNVVGFLYSVSCHGTAEYWPLYLGTNTIGKGGNNDIRLQEASVSSSHAIISIKKMKTTGKMIAYIRDVGSKNGIYLNDTELDYEGHACQNNDVISIGNAYKLLLILIDTESRGLTAAENFMETGQDADDVRKKDTKQSMSPFDKYSRKRTNNTDTMDVNGADLLEPGETKYM